MRLWRYLLNGNDEQFMPDDWLADRDRLAAYIAWTEQEACSRVVKDTAQTQREQFWQALEAKKQKAPNVFVMRQAQR